MCRGHFFAQKCIGQCSLHCAHCTTSLDTDGGDQAGAQRGAVGCLLRFESLVKVVSVVLMVSTATMAANVTLMLIDVTPYVYELNAGSGGGAE